MKPLYPTGKRRPRPDDVTRPTPETLAYLEDCAAAHALAYWLRFRNFLALEDTTQEAILGVYRARDTYDPERGASFNSWATTCILNALTEYRRREDGRPRSMQDGSRPTPPERLPALSLDAPLASCDPASEPLDIGGAIADTRPGPEALAQFSELRERLAEEMARLPERWREVERLYFWEGWTFKSIGELMAVSESRVFQIHQQAMKRLRLSLGGTFA